MVPRELSPFGIDKLLEGEIVVLQIMSYECVTKNLKNQSIPCIL